MCLEPLGRAAVTPGWSEPSFSGSSCWAVRLGGTTVPPASASVAAGFESWRPRLWAANVPRVWISNMSLKINLLSRWWAAPLVSRFSGDDLRFWELVLSFSKIHHSYFSKQDAIRLCLLDQIFSLHHVDFCSHIIVWLLYAPTLLYNNKASTYLYSMSLGLFSLKNK